MKRILGLLAAFLFAVSTPAFAAPLPYNNNPLDTIQGAINTTVASFNSSYPEAAYITACSGTTTATCQGTRLNISVTGLTTAHGALASAMTVTDASVTASSQIICQPQLYAGTGTPIDVNVIPGAGSFTFQVQNNDPSAALNATVVSACLVYN